jgi:hypothetical protein
MYVTALPLTTNTTLSAAAVVDPLVTPVVEGDVQMPTTQGDVNSIAVPIATAEAVTDVIKEDSSQIGAGPSEDDLMAIADAVREVASATLPSAGSSAESLNNNLISQDAQLGRRGHLRAVTS